MGFYNGIFVEEVKNNYCQCCESKDVQCLESQVSKYEYETICKECLESFPTDKKLLMFNHLEQEGK